MKAEQLYAASKMWADGVIGKKIAEKYGMSKRVFYDFCERNRDLFPSRRTEMTGDVIARMSVMWKRGDNQAKILAATRVCRDRFKRAMRDFPELFPERICLNGVFYFAENGNHAIVNIKENRVKPVREGTMRFTTSTGYVCTMPRVSILEKKNAVI